MFSKIFNRMIVCNFDINHNICTIQKTLTNEKYPYLIPFFFKFQPSSCLCLSILEEVLKQQKQQPYQQKASEFIIFNSLQLKVSLSCLFCYIITGLGACSTSTKTIIKSFILEAVESLRLWTRLVAEYNKTDTLALADESLIWVFQPGI